MNNELPEVLNFQDASDHTIQIQNMGMAFHDQTWLKDMNSNPSAIHESK